jgi:thiol:disulfide interchange protein DsbC
MRSAPILRFSNHFRSIRISGAFMRLPRLLNPLITVLFLTLGLIAGASAQTSEAKMRETIEKTLEGVHIVSITKSPYLGLYEVFTGENILYVDEKVTVVVAGDLIDLQTKKYVTRDRMGALSSVKFSELPLKQAFKQVHGNGKRVMATFEDPNCGYCKKLAKELAKVDNVTIYTFLVPVLGPDSDKKSRQIWCSDNPTKVWNEWMVEGKPLSGSTNCDTGAIRRNSELAEKLRVRGTPAIVFESGERVPGFVTQDVIEQKLGK